MKAKENETPVGLLVSSFNDNRALTPSRFQNRSVIRPFAIRPHAHRAPHTTVPLYAGPLTLSFVGG